MNTGFRTMARLGALLFALVLGAGVLGRVASGEVAHDPLPYMDDVYLVAGHQAMSQTMCHHDEGTIIQSITAAAPGTYWLTTGNLAVNEWKGEIVKGKWAGTLEGDVLTWRPTAAGERLVVEWHGVCILRMPRLASLDKTPRMDK